MSGRPRDRFRKYESGSSKPQKRKLREEFVKSQTGALDKYMCFSKKEGSGKNDNDCSDDGDNESLSDLSSSAANSPNLAVSDDKSGYSENIDAGNNSYPHIQILKDIYDPGHWEHVTNDVRDLLVEKGPIRLPDDYEYPINEEKRHFSRNFCIRKMANNEFVDRRWLIYSQFKDAAFCFCCKLYGKSSAGKLANGGCNDWKHLGVKLENHELTAEHINNMKTWFRALKRMSRNDGIDSMMLEHKKKEKLHWRAVLTRILAVVQYLAENNSAFRGKTQKLYQPNNGKFLGLIQMLAKFDPTIQEHVRRIKDGETHVHYLGHQIQNEFIELMASEVKKIIIDTLKRAKYFSTILDCTPDVSHKEQLSLIVRFVDIDDWDIKVVQHFIEFFYC